MEISPSPYASSSRGPMKHPLLGVRIQVKVEVFPSGNRRDMDDPDHSFAVFHFRGYPGEEVFTG